MFRTKSDDMAGLPGMFSEGLAHWHSVSRVLKTHWYHVSVKERHEGHFTAMVEILNDETKLHELLLAQSEDFVVTEVQVVTPPWMNKSASWQMENLTAVSVGYDKNDIPVCLLEVASGSVYADVHDPSFDAKFLADVQKIY